MGRLATGAELLERAAAGGYAVGAFNINNMEIVQAIVEAANEERSPVIMQASQGAIKYAGIDYITALGRTAVEGAKVPVCLHLDHGTDMAQVMLCIRHGFSSVMYDGSRHPLETNIANTRKVVDVAHAVGVSVEGELGKIGGVEDDVKVEEREALFTDPDEALRFVRETGVDSLAIAIGTAHGLYKGEPDLDFDRMAKIRSLVGAVPFVLHGGSGVPEWQIRRAIELGVRKINIDTELRDAFVRRLQAEIRAKPDEIDPRKLLGPAKEAMKQRVREKMRLFGSSGKA